MNRSGPTHYDVDISLHCAYGLCRPTTLGVLQYLDKERASLAKHANVQSVLDQKNQKLHSLEFCVPSNFLCYIFFFGKIIGNIDTHV